MFTLQINPPRTPCTTNQHASAFPNAPTCRQQPQKDAVRLGCFAPALHCGIPCCGLKDPAAAQHPKAEAAEMRRSSQHLMSETEHLAGAAPWQPLADGLYKQAFEETNSLECGDEDEADSPSTSCKNRQVPSVSN